MLRSLTLASLLAFSVCSFAEETPAELEAKTLYAKRSETVEGIANAGQAAEAYKALADGEVADMAKKATLLNKESQAAYYVGTQVKTDAEKIPVFLRAMKAADAAIAALTPTEATLDEAGKEILATSYYYSGANLGKWAEANGIASSLGRWGELQDKMKKVIALKKESVQAYGAFRILGRAYYKLPAPLGSNKKALYYLEKAFNATKLNNDVNEISIHGLNVLFYADLLIATDRKPEAKAILTSFVAKDANTFNPDRIPETKAEQKEAAEKLKDL